MPSAAYDNTTRMPRVSAHQQGRVGKATVTIIDPFTGQEVTVARGVPWPMAHAAAEAIGGAMRMGYEAQSSEL